MPDPNQNTETPSVGQGESTSPKTQQLVNKLSPQQITEKYKSPYITSDRAQWGQYLDKSFPYSGTNIKQAVYSAANDSGISPGLLYSSAMEEGMREGIDKPETSSISYNEAANNKKFDPNDYPVDGFRTYGLDTFGDQAANLIKKGYLPKDFAKNYTTFNAQNELNQNVHSAAFKTEDAALQAKAAVLRNTRDNLQDYAKKNNITLTPKQLDFFNLAGYNGGEGTMQKMIQSYKQKGYLKDDSFLNNTAFKPSSFGAVYTNVQRRLANNQVMQDQGDFSDYKSTNKKYADDLNAQKPTQEPADLTSKNLEDWNKYKDSGDKTLKDYISKNPKTSLTEGIAPAIEQKMSEYKDLAKKQVEDGSKVYAEGVHHGNFMKDHPHSSGETQYKFPKKHIDLHKKEENFSAQK